MALPAVAAQPKSDGRVMTLAGKTLPMESVRGTRFKFLDLDADGYLTRDEIGKDDIVLRSQFDSLDTNRDGRLSEQEYALYGPAR